MFAALAETARERQILLGAGPRCLKPGHQSTSALPPTAAFRAVLLVIRRRWAIPREVDTGFHAATDISVAL